MITSASNEKIKRLRKLLAQKSARDAEGVFVIEGEKQVREAPRSLLLEVYLSSAASDGLKTIWFSGAEASCAYGFSVYEVEEGLFDRISDVRTPQGILAVVRKPAWDLSGILRGIQQTKVPGQKGQELRSALLLLAERLQDPGNAGTILRTAEAAGADAVVFSSESADIYSPKVVRSAMGSVFRMPVLYEEDIISSIQKLRENGVRVHAAHLQGSIPYDEPDYTEPCAFLIGNEGRGLTEEAAAAADDRIRIPMAGKIESLNAAMSAGILLYEAARQRQKD